MRRRSSSIATVITAEAAKRYGLQSATVQPTLRLQAQEWEDEAAALFDHIPVKPGWECIDVGCGTMGVLRPLSERVGEGGRVLGIDADDSFVKAAERFVSDNELQNVRVKHADIFANDLPDEMF